MTQDFAEYESYMYWLDQNLIQAGVDSGTLQTEHAPGQFEFAIKPKFGIEAADMMFRLKQGVKEMSAQRNIDATFMTKPDYPSCGNGSHYNHSLWYKAAKENAFYDSKNADGLSEVALQWIAGLIKHAPALTALCSPTVNCYRRLRVEPAPDSSDWGIDDRFAAYRVKSISPHETYIENRIASGSANPYLILAATVAAGTSGVADKLTPPPQREGNEPDLPRTLSEALVALQQDKVMVAALGDEFVDWFVKMKQGMEINALRGDSIQDERRLYLKVM